MNTLAKICGTTSPADARLAAEAGADFVGVVLHPSSPRFVAPDAVASVVAEVRAAAPGAKLVLVTVNLARATLLELWETLQPDALQLHGDETPELVRELVGHGCVVWKVLSGSAASLRRAAEIYTRAGAEALMVDAREVTANGVLYGGTGQIADWNAARELVDAGYRVMLAGGLTPENVARAIQTVQPWAVDVVSGVEARKGAKDAAKVREFLAQVKQVAGPSK